MKKQVVKLSKGTKLAKNKTETVVFDRSKLDHKEQLVMHLCGFSDGASRRPPQYYGPEMEQAPYQQDYNLGYAQGKESFLSNEKEAKNIYNVE